MYEKIEKFQVTEIPGVGFEVHGLWQDDVHDLRTRLVFDAKSFVLVEVEVEAVRIPFEVCLQGIKTIEVLKGKGIGPGFTKTVNKHVMGKEGCYHLGELVIGSVKAVIQAASRQCPEWMDEDIYSGFWTDWISRYKDLCIYFAQPNVTQAGIQNDRIN